MTFVPLKIVGKCVADDETLFQNMESAVARGYPQVLRQESPKDGVIALVASGPSVAGQIDVIREMSKTTLIVAIKDAHDWLIDNGVIPDYALAIDPQEHRISFYKPNHGVEYMIASQCHKAMFDNLEGQKVTIWHPYVMKGQNRPKNSLLIGGGTTSGLRAISLFYVLGWRHFALFGFDSCLTGDMLRINGSGLKEGEPLTEVRIEQDGETFYCNPSMALQAEHFQTYYDYLPDSHYYGFGHGLIQAIIKKREENAVELQALIDKKREPNDRVSFIHWGDKNSASWRYRAKIVSDGWAELNDFSADTLIFAKPQANELMEMARAKARGAWVIVDFCDDHFDWVHYKEALRLADAVSCNTEVMKKIIKEHGRDATVIGDPYEYPEAKPHYNGLNLLWYGHAVNKHSLERILPDLEGYNLRVVSNFGGAIPWSHETMLEEFARADIVLMPATAEYKSPNRAIEAIRQGCFVVSERDLGIPHIYVGNILEGIKWTQTQDINTLISKAQKFVMDEFTPQILIDKWKTLTAQRTTSDVEKRSGTDG
ncbi:6-hydroxymethylpterin diphosphokinase MptE-like [uncultured Caudovirales phage]|uniref:6-hydroxymethylpterin diphosphokinase MptE-like n=1 Tax=uncultured Caudovirales phage TaxID=2100421 RepID=A0A6J5L5C1_9CAUD|nr:6-hydroxymethylpterin diphosphokinase MptE-like [uncultured Caudovirales phage]